MISSSITNNLCFCRTGKQYLSWKYNKAFCSPYIEAKELESNGLDLKNGSDFVNILESSNLIHNDLFCIEAPWFHFRNGYHYLFFSANWYDSPDYFTGTCTEIYIALKHDDSYGDFLLPSARTQLTRDHCSY